MTLKLYLNQRPDAIAENTGIGRVVHAQYRHLPKYDIELVSDPGSADIRAVHATDTRIPDLDILMCHGLYWSGDPGSGHYAGWNHDINQRIVADARRARAITVPSDWVAEPFRRDMRLEPEVIGHGIELEQWEPGASQGYILWNKNRAADVCDPASAYALAERGETVVSTYAPAGAKHLPSLTLTGSLPHEEMRERIRGAYIYLATTKETFGIGTLEAMACGKPVVGYDHGGTAGIVRHGIEGYLVRPGDIDGLEEGIRYIEHRYEEFSKAARLRAESYTWERVMEQYAQLFHRVADERKQETHGVSVVISNFNYGKYVSGAIESCLAQTMQPTEIIVVDDGSTDNSQEVIKETLPGLPVLVKNEPDHFTLGSANPNGLRVTLITQENRGVAAARNRGIAEARSPYIICLDADDRLDPLYIEALLPQMKADRGLGVAYTGLAFLDDRGHISPNPGWPIPFDWAIQAKGGVPPGNCIPAAAMFRRAMWERAGGYKQEHAPAEDAEFWTRGLSIGFTARQVTEAGLFHYRAHAGSASRTKPYKPIDAHHPWVKDRVYPIGAPAKEPPRIRSYSDPAVTVIIPEHPQYERVVETLIGQSIRSWEGLIHMGRERTGALGIPKHFPFLRKTGGDWREIKTGPLVLLLERGERLEPGELDRLFQAYQAGEQHDPRLRCKECGAMAQRSCCGGNGAATLAIKRAYDALIPSVEADEAPLVDGYTRMRFTGQRTGAVTYKGTDLRRMYRGGNNANSRFANVHQDDVAKLLGTGEWEVVPRQAPALPVVAEPVQAESEAEESKIQQNAAKPNENEEDEEIWPEVGDKEEHDAKLETAAIAAGVVPQFVQDLPKKPSRQDRKAKR